MSLSSRAAQLVRAATRAQALTQTGRATEEPTGRLPKPAIGVAMSGAMKHGGLYTLADPSITSVRLDAMMTEWMMQQDDQIAARRHVADMAVRGTAIPGYFFYHISPKPYKLHSRLISYLTYPNLHLRSPIRCEPNATTEPHSPVGRTFSVDNESSDEIPAVFTFVGQFIDHDLTLNAMNLFEMQDGEVMSQASPFLDLDSVYGARVDVDRTKDPTKPTPIQLREIPVEDGFFRLRKIADKKYDVCRQDKGGFGQHCSALIGDKRNDENQIILQIHILLMRLHNAFRNQYGDFKKAKQQTILHWQKFVLDSYLPTVVDPEVIKVVQDRLKAGKKLVHRPGRTVCSGCTLGMPHEFAIGFRFGHSQLRSHYELSPGKCFRLFDSLSNGQYDLQGGKCLSEDRLINWPFFLSKTGAKFDHPSNLIDTCVNQVVFDLPESTIPDDIKPVSNLPFRNLVRSDEIGLCAGEDLVEAYNCVYGQGTITPLKPEDVEPNCHYRPLFTIETRNPNDPKGPQFRTPLWYYLLREAELHRKWHPERGGRLGVVGSYLVAEVILSAIWYAPVSLLNPDPLPCTPAKETGIMLEPFGPSINLLSIAEFVDKNDHSPHGCIGNDPCAGCGGDDPPLPLLSEDCSGS